MLQMRHSAVSCTAVKVQNRSQTVPFSGTRGSKCNLLKNFDQKTPLFSSATQEMTKRSVTLFAEPYSAPVYWFVPLLSSSFLHFFQFDQQVLLLHTKWCSAPQHHLQWQRSQNRPWYFWQMTCTGPQVKQFFHTCLCYLMLLSTRQLNPVSEEIKS